MKAAFVFIVLTCCLGYSSATFNLLKTKADLLQKAVDYLSSTVVVPEPLPASYARPSYTTHVSTFSVSLPSAEPYVEPVAMSYVQEPTYGLPQVRELTYVSPIVHPHAVAVSAPILQYHQPETLYAEQLTGHFIAEHYLPVDREIGNW